jgi:hypothetical protein
MQYMFMCCFDENAWHKLPEGQKDKIMRDYGNWVETLVSRGRLHGGARLQPTSSAKTVRVKNGTAVFNDGPFAETKEQLGGFHLVECVDLDEAMQIAARIPTLPAGGVVEVRRVDEIEGKIPDS